MSAKFFICEHCGNIAYMVVDKGVTPTCCGSPMKELKAGEVEAATEKHIPVAKKDGNNVVVTVGSVEHPMTAEHYIMWVALETDKGIKINSWTPDSKPTVTIPIPAGANVKAVYAYCNLHGLWKTESIN